MDNLLRPLLEVDGVLGALLLSGDGLTVAAANFDHDEAETVSALTMAMMAALRATAERLAIGDLRDARLTTDGGRLELHALSDLLLLVLTEPDPDRPTLDAVLAEVTSRCLELVA